MRVCGLKFSSRVEQNVDYMENFKFSSHVDMLGIPGWCNRYELTLVILDSTRYTELKSQPQLKISI